MRIHGRRICLSTICIGLIVTCFWLIGNSVKAKSEDAFSTQLVLSESGILPLEPVGALVTLKNKSDQQQVLSSGYWGANLFIRRGEDGPWLGYGKLGPSIGIPPKATVRTFQPAEFIQDYIVLDIDLQNQPAFPNPGNYWIKARFAGIESSPQKLEVREPAGKDQAAFQYLKQDTLYRYFSRETVLHDFRVARREEKQYLDPSERLKSFIKAYSQSRYAQWAQLGLLFVKEAPSILSILTATGDTPENVTTLKSVRKEIEKLAVNLPAPLNTTAWFEAGVAASLLRDDVAAQADFSKATLKNDPTIVARINLFQEFLKKHVYVGDPNPAADPKIILDQVIKELEGKRYDVVGFSRKKPKEYKEYLKIAIPWLEDMQARRITPEEYYRRTAELLKTYVTKYSEPLSPEEWQQLQSERAKADTKRNEQE